MGKEHMTETLRYLGPEDDDTGREETKEIKTYFLDGKIVEFLQKGIRTSTLVMFPSAAPPELLPKLKGNVEIVVTSDIVEDRNVGDFIQISHVIDTEHGLMTREAYNLLYGPREESRAI